MNLSKTIVVNWHVTETCNYHCKYCFAKWNKPFEMWCNPANVEKVISNLYKHFRSHGFSHIRLSIVGGEPVMFPERLWNVVEIAYKYGMEISIITNGCRLENIRPFAHLISQVGISVDSLDHQTNVDIGRECGGKTISFEQLYQKIECIRKANPDIKFKLNTVVNEFNYNEILVEKFAKLKVHKWKILRQMPFNGKGGVSDYQFYAFVKNNYKEDLMRENAPLTLPFPSVFDAGCSNDGLSKQVIFIEDNDAMTESYLMISPDGRLFQNGGEQYSYSRPLTDVSMTDALSDIKFDWVKFDNRYEVGPTVRAVGEADTFSHLNDYDYDIVDCFCDLSDD
ncbi:MAG: viperin family antiviral radical SAM protein [Fibrobacter sp.]|nr:viperin family antiviral radical SAM protein [Fibrobacter sp.]